jgi:hypothetical protein
LSAQQDSLDEDVVVEYPDIRGVLVELFKWKARCYSTEEFLLYDPLNNPLPHFEYQEVIERACLRHLGGCHPKVKVHLLYILRMIPKKRSTTKWADPLWEALLLWFHPMEVLVLYFTYLQLPRSNRTDRFVQWLAEDIQRTPVGYRVSIEMIQEMAHSSLISSQPSLFKI